MSDEQYFSRAERGCVDCPTTGRFGILAGVVVVLAGTGLFLYRALARAEAWAASEHVLSSASRRFTRPFADAHTPAIKPHYRVLA